MNDLFCTVPEDGTQCKTLLLALQRGEKLRPLDSALRYGIYALSQRAGELRRDYGWPIQSQMVKTSTGKRVKEYWLATQQRKAA